MINEEKARKFKGDKIEIDYENIDVADIMDQIRRKIAKKPKKPVKEISREEWPFASPSRFPVEPEETPGAKTKIKKVLLKIMKPFSPLIKLLILPVHEELRETVRILDQTNKRLDFVNRELERLDHAMGDLGKTMEYTKLLHNLSHNIVVELSKLKIEEENMKIKTRIMEKDFELLGRRERALERHIFK